MRARLRRREREPSGPPAALSGRREHPRAAEEMASLYEMGTESDGNVDSERGPSGGRDEALPRCYLPPRTGGARDAARTPPRSACARRLLHCTRRVWLLFQAKQLFQTKRLWICRHASGEIRAVHAFERRDELSRSEQQRTPAINQPDRSELAHVPDGIQRLSEARAERPGRPPRADSRPTARRARVRPMHTQARVPAVPRSASDRTGCPGVFHGGQQRVLSRHQHERVAVGGVQAGSQGLRSAAASLTSPIDEQHAPAVAIPAKQQEARDAR
jgi:hypothetical protein